MPTPKAKTRLQVYSSPEPLFSPKPTKEEMCRLFGIDEHSFLAAQRRLERAEERNHHDRRQIGTADERQRLAEFAKESVGQRLAQSKQMLTPILMETIQNYEISILKMVKMLYH